MGQTVINFLESGVMSNIFAKLIFNPATISRKPTKMVGGGGGFWQCDFFNIIS